MVDGTNRGWTRRQLLEMAGRAGGESAVYEVMVALGLLNSPEPWDGPPQLPQVAGTEPRVIIIGAGIGGLTAAYILSRAGYHVRILEAQNRAGGRSLTARRGTVITEESAEHGVTRQQCQFDEGLYVNMGPGRIPYHHRRVLHFCQELGVPLEVYVMEAMAALFQTDAGLLARPEVRRRVAYDTNGHIAELLAKAVRSGTLDAELVAEDQARLLDLLQVYGDLGEGGRDPLSYDGSTRVGCHARVSVYQSCQPPAPVPLPELLRSHFWRHRFYQPFEYEWQPTLFQPVGGMDRIVEGFQRAIGDLIQYRAAVVTVSLQPDGVTVAYRDNAAGRNRRVRADFVISSIPLPVLHKVRANFSPDFRAAVDRGRFADTCKVGWQAEQRFWEQNRYQIYGGISYTSDTITQICYPSNDYFARKGTLTGLYNYDEQAVAFGRLGLRERLKRASQGGAKLHPEIADDRVVPLDLGLSIAWQNVPFERGGWAVWDPDSLEDRAAYTRLLCPDGQGRFYVVGDQVSTLPGWQEGAMMSAEHVVEQIAGLRPLTIPLLLNAPNTRRLVQGRF